MAISRFCLMTTRDDIMNDYKHINYKESEEYIKTRCPDCGAENPPGTRNCSFCGRALVNIKEEKTEESFMSSDEILRDSVKGFQDFMHNTTKNLHDINQKRGVPNISKEESKKRIFIGVIIVVVCMAILLGVYVTIVNLTTLAIAHQAANQDVEKINVVFNIFSIVRSVFLMIGFLICVFVVLYVFRKKKKTETTYLTKCPSCGGNNPAKSTVCGYCGRTLVTTKTTNTSGEFAKNLANDAEKVIKDMVNDAYDLQDEYNKKHGGS